MKEKVCVLKGGLSPERQISLKSGKAVEDALKERGYKVFALDPKSNDFLSHLRREKPDLVFIALHGSFGEDGTVQGLLEMAGIPYTGSGVLASILGMDKVSSRRLFAWQGLPQPCYQVVAREETRDIKRILSPPVVVKPSRSGSTLGINLIMDGSGLKEAMKEAFRYDSSYLLIEEFIRGREITVGIIDDPEPRPFPIVEVVPQSAFFDYQAKYSPGFCKFFVPANLKEKQSLRAKEVALKAYCSLGCRDFARVDMILKEDTPYILEVNTIPGLTERSLLPLAARAEGLSFPQLIERIVRAALRRSPS